MKKIFLFAAVAVSALVSSCDMELEPEGAIKQEEAIVNPVNARYFRNGFYLNFRSLAQGPLNNYTEVQMDNFQALAPTYGNQLGNMFKGDFTSSTSDFAGAFSLFYSNIAPVNFYLPRLQELIESEDWTSQDHLKMIRYRGEAHFIRAYNYFMLAQFFCQDYSEANKDVPAMGVPLVTEYNPTTDRSVYPGRSTLAETYKLILDDLEQAENDLDEYEASLRSGSDEFAELITAGASYINSYAVHAFRARVARAMGDNEKAAQYAQDIIDCGLYKLANQTDYQNLWIGKPEGGLSEIILQCAVTEAEAQSLGQTNTLYFSYNTSTAMYVPANSTIAMYSNQDVRKNSWFLSDYLELNGTYLTVTMFWKQSGLSMFGSLAASRGCYIAYPLRLAEMYLIVAECASDISARNQALRTLRTARGASNRNYNEVTIVPQVRLERNRELIGEGFRMNDLRRYGEGFTRDDSTPLPNFPVENFNTLYFVQGAMDLHYDADDHRFVWPIPSTEIQVNPQIVGQQNPGY
ncbi:MAG: RagB/SusD family nutrient uptake outer membrane protein [Muribaculaceae bacterium]|nr:RagB/SusD family nutrient uptake outer membrane protein [Muribaculaceae bacterium]MDE6130195.1 RagB/SusD family nutrient uptake outer membrane protein [Muribaculaceae bacterium]